MKRFYRLFLLPAVGVALFGLVGVFNVIQGNYYIALMNILIAIQCLIEHILREHIELLQKMLRDRGVEV